MAKLALTEEHRARLFDYDRQGPLASFDARIGMAAALRICGPQTVADLDSIRHVRNAFAHTATNLSFDSDAVAQMYLALHTPTTVAVLTRHMPGEPEYESRAAILSRPCCNSRGHVYK